LPPPAIGDRGQTTCALFTDCLGDMKRWSDANPGHHPIVAMLEIKDGFDPGYVDRFFELFEAEILSVWPRDRIIMPDSIRGDDATLAEAIATRGWPKDAVSLQPVDRAPGVHRRGHRKPGLRRVMR
jgi:hypothetical protein